MNFQERGEFWKNSTVAVIGGGSWGTVLADLLSEKCRQVRLHAREEEQVRQLNATRSNPNYVKDLQLNDRVQAFTELERVFERPLHAVIWALPSSVCREQAKLLAGHFTGSEILLHATKGVEEGSFKRISEVLAEELPCPRIGVISGPNLANEVARREPAATVIASKYNEVVEAGTFLLSSNRFRVYAVRDVVGVEWAGTLKNVLAIASGALEGLGFGWSARAMLITRGLAEMVKLGSALGAEPATFLGLAGVGDLLATCSSPLSRNYRVGMSLAKGEKLEDILSGLGSTAEGVRTTRSVVQFARSKGVILPITEAVYQLLSGGVPAQEILKSLMAIPTGRELGL